MGAPEIPPPVMCLAPEDCPNGSCVILHGSVVAVGQKGLLLYGASGSGKSMTAAAMIGLGAELVADDRAQIAPSAHGPVARAAPHLDGLIELRGIGIVRAPFRESVTLVAAINLDGPLPDRLPHSQFLDLFGHRIELLSGRHSVHLPAMLMLYLKGERLDP